MDKMQKLQSVNDKIRTLKNDSGVLGELCLQIQEYISDERFLPEELQDRTLAHLQNMKEVQDACKAEYAELVGDQAFPDTYDDADTCMKRQYELFCKEEIVQAAVRFKNLVTENPLEVDALKEAQEKTEIIDPAGIALDECREMYQPYIDFLDALAENNAGARICYVRKLEATFSPELIAGAVINQDIYDPEGSEEQFVEEDLDEYDSNTEDMTESAVPSYLSDEDIDEAEEAAAPEEAAASEEAEASEEAASQEEAAEKVLTTEEPVQEAAPEEVKEAAAAEIFPEQQEEADRAGETAEKAAVIEDYLEDFDRNYIQYYRIANDKAEPFVPGHLAKWPEGGETFGPEGVKKCLTDLGFHVSGIEEQDRIRGKYENYTVVLDGQDREPKADEPNVLVNFRREACESGFRVVCLYGSFSGEGLSRAFREIGNRHHTLILFQEPVTQGVRRSLARLVRKKDLHKEFALIDKAVYVYLDSHYGEDETNKMFLDIVMPGPETK